MTFLKKMIEYFRNLCYHIFRIKFYDEELKEVVIMNKGDLTVFDMANFFRTKEKMTHKKLQKLVYYAYAWYIALYNENKEELNNKLCTDTKFEAWIHGPVCRKLYDKYSYNYGVVEKYNGELNPLIDGELKKFLDLIYKTFGKYTGDELETMTHKEYPWQNARNTLASYMPSNNPILEVDMFEFYNSL